MQGKTNDLALVATIRAAAPYRQRRARRNGDVAIAIEEGDISREKKCQYTPGGEKFNRF